MTTTRKTSQNFGSGGCYKCQSCGKNTRATGRQDNEHVGLCVRCYDMGGDQNCVWDGTMTVDEFTSKWGEAPEA